MFFLFYLYHFSRSKYIGKQIPDHLISRQHLSTFFFDDLHKQVTILGRPNTYFFISKPSSNSLSYFIKYDTNDKTKAISPKEKRILNDIDFIKLNEQNCSKTTFKLESKIGTENTEKAATISFLSFKLADECQNGIEFISSKEDISKYKKTPKKCYYSPPDDINPAVLYTFSHTYESSLMKRSKAMDFSKIPFRQSIKAKNRINSQQKIDLKSIYSSSPKTHIKDKNEPKILSETKQKAQKVTESTTTSTKPRSSSQFVLPATSISMGILVALILLVLVCTSKQSVEASSGYAQNEKNMPTAAYQTGTISPYADACRSNYNQQVYMDPNIVYYGVVPYQGAKPFKRHMKDNVADGIMNVPT